MSAECPTTIRSVITHLGGITGLAKGLKHKNVTTVQGWWDREVIPAHRQREVLDYAKERGTPIPPGAVIPGYQTANAGAE